MSNVVSSILFGIRRVDKTGKQKDPVSALIAGGQFRTAGESIIALDNEVGKTAKTAVEAFNIAAKNEKLLSYAGKVINFASENVNPLICVSSGLKVILADDKDTAIITNAAALGSMFAVESLMKKEVNKVTEQQALDKLLIGAKDAALESKTLGKTAKNLLTFAEKHGGTGKWATVAHGVAFVAGSCLAYSAGEKFGTLVAKKVYNVIIL